jgi:hypothetical protein
MPGMTYPSRNLSCVLLASLLSAAAAVSAAAWPTAETGSAVREVKGFDRVELAIRGELVLTQGDRESLTIEASASDLAQITTAVRGTTLQIAHASPGPGPRGPVTYRLTMKRIAGLATSSSGNIQANTVEADSLRIAVSSSGSVTIGRLTAKTLDVTLSSSGSCTVAGTVDGQKIQLSSSGEYRAEHLDSRTASIGVSSSGSATIRVLESLEARISSSGSVRYLGNPPRVTSSTSSSGRLIRLD